MSTQGADRAGLILSVSALVFAVLVGSSALLFGLAKFYGG